MADSSQADTIISDIEGQYLLADRAYDTNYVLDLVASKGRGAVIPSKRNRKKKRIQSRKSVSSGVYVSEIKNLARYCYSICEKHVIIYGCSTNMLYVPLALRNLATSSIAFPQNMNKELK